MDLMYQNTDSNLISIDLEYLIKFETVFRIKIIY